MNDITVTSNIRMPSNEWNKIRINAAEMNMSINQYIRHIINQVSIKEELISAEKIRKNDYPIWSVYDLSSQKKKSKSLSVDDKIIYDSKKK